MKNTKNVLKATLAISAISLAVSAHAATEKPSGFYVEGNAGYGYVNEDVSHSLKDDKDGLGWNANAGYKINRNFAVEGGYYGFPKEDFGTGINGDNNYAVAADVKGMIPFHNGLNLFGKVGIADSHHSLDVAHNNYASYSTSEATAMGGAGVGYAITEHLGANAQIDAFSSHGDVPPMYMTTLGVSYIF